VLENLDDPVGELDLVAGAGHASESGEDEAGAGLPPRMLDPRADLVIADVRP
jgi:hypothetical protein